MGIGDHLGRALRRWADSGDQQVRDLRAEHGVAGATAIAEVRDRIPVVLRGTIREVTLMPREEAPSMEAILDDGTGQVTLIWMGRRRILGLEAGRSVRVWGRIGLHEGRRVIYNPRYELVV